MEVNMMLNTKKFGVAGGLVWGLAMFITTLLAVSSGYGAEFLGMFTSLYFGYSISLLGSVIGLFWGFIDGFIGCYVFAWIYNKLDI
jgi:hypothetical protein